MRISDWSSDVCSSDLVIVEVEPDFVPSRRQRIGPVDHSPLKPEPVVHEAWHPVSHEQAIAAEAAALRHQHAVAAAGRHLDRSEEHTSELQSLMRIPYAVFCLKKNKKQNTYAQH